MCCLPTNFLLFENKVEHSCLVGKCKVAGNSLVRLLQVQFGRKVVGTCCIRIHAKAPTLQKGDSLHARTHRVSRPL